MSAHVGETDPRYYAYCPVCIDGSDDYDNEQLAQDWADQHNAENHQRESDE